MTSADLGRGRLVSYGLLALLLTLPVTLPVPVLRGLVVERFGVSEFLGSLFMSVNMIGAVLVAPLAGLLADRTGRRRPWILIAIGIDALLFGMLVLPLPFPIFMTIRLLEGGAHITSLSLLLSLGADSAPDARRGRVMGLLGAGITLGVAFGAALGGVLGRHGTETPLLAGSALLAACLVLAALALRETRAGSAPPGLREILRGLRENRALGIPLLFAFIDRFTVGFFTTTFPFFLKRVHDSDPQRIGMLLAMMLLPFGLLSYPFGRLSERVSRTALICSGSFLYGLGVIAVGRVDASSLTALMPVLGVLSAVMFVPNLVMTTDLAPTEARATALAGFNAAGSLGFIIGPAVGGAVSGAYGYPAAFLVAGLSEVACVLVAFVALCRLVRAGRTT